MSNKLFTSKKSEQIIENTVNLLGLKNSNFIIARLALAITISLKKTFEDVPFADTEGKEFNNYTLFKGEGYDYLLLIRTLMSNLYGRELKDEELLGNSGLIKKHIDEGCKIIDEIYQEVKPNKNKFIRKLYALKFDKELISDLGQDTKFNDSPNINLPKESDNDLFVNETISKIKEFLDNLGFDEILETEHTLSSSILRVKIKFPPLNNKYVTNIRSRTEDLKLHLALNTEPLISVFGGYLCIDVPRPEREFVYLKDVIDRVDYKSPVTFPIGLDIDGNVVTIDLADSTSPHLLIGGATGQGKSELLKSIIVTLATKNTPETVQMYLLDPKKVEFTKFKKFQEVKAVITEVKDAINLLESLAEEMDRRYDLLREYEVNNIDKYNQLVLDKKPHIVVIFDEFADFILNEKEVKESLENLIKRLTGKARAAGIHLILATQRPDAEIVTGVIKANLPARIAFRTSTGMNSRVIIDTEDAKDLLGKGDLIYVKESNPIRIQAPYIPDNEIDLILNHIF